MFLKKTAVSVVIMLLSIPLIATITPLGDNRTHDQIDKALSCSSGATVMKPDKKEETILLILFNTSKYQLRIKTNKGALMRETEINSGFCIKRFMGPGIINIEVDARQKNRYLWIKTLEEWFMMGGNTLILEIADEPYSVQFAQISNEDIIFYSTAEYWEKNWPQYFNIAFIYGYTLLLLIFLPYIIWKIIKAPISTK